MNKGFLIGYVVLNVLVCIVYLWFAWWRWNNSMADKKPAETRK